MITADDIAGFFAAFDDSSAGAAIADIERLYHPDVRFQDPVQTLHGIDAVIDMTRRLAERARVLRFDVGDHAQRGDVIFIAWTMIYQLRAGGPTMRFEGVSHLRTRDGLVVDHRDYWDLLGSVMDAVPIAGPLYKRAIARLG